MSAQDDGGPFHPTTQQIDGNGEVVMYAYCGASLRDHFAGLAMAAMVSSSATNEAIARSAYEIADAMLQARKEKAP